MICICKRTAAFPPTFPNTISRGFLASIPSSLVPSTRITHNWACIDVYCLGFTRSYCFFYWILLDFAGFYLVVPGCTEFYRVLLGFTEFYRVLLVFIGLLAGMTGLNKIRLLFLDLVGIRPWSLWRLLIGSIQMISRWLDCRLCGVRNTFGLRRPTFASSMWLGVGLFFLPFFLFPRHRSALEHHCISERKTDEKQITKATDRREKKNRTKQTVSSVVGWLCLKIAEARFWTTESQKKKGKRA